MALLFPVVFQVNFVMPVLLDLNSNIFYYFPAVSCQTDPFSWIIGHQTHFTDSQITQYLSADPVVPLIHLKSQFQVGIYRIKSVLLKMICLQLVNQSNTSSLLVHIQDRKSTRMNSSH